MSLNLFHFLFLTFAVHESVREQVLKNALPPPQTKHRIRSEARTLSLTAGGSSRKHTSRSPNASAERMIVPTFLDPDSVEDQTTGPLHPLHDIVEREFLGRTSASTPLRYSLAQAVK